MKYNWKKLGCVYCPTAEDGYTHAMFPNVVILDEPSGLIRIYYTHRDKNNYGFPTYLDATIIDDKFNIIYNHNEPIIERNIRGTFDDSGINVTSIVRTDDGLLFYYLAWNLAVTVPFRNSIGLAKANENGTWLSRPFEGPLLDRARDFPYLCATPFVMKEGSKYRMWYASGEPWLFTGDVAEVACCICYAESSNGFDWDRQGIVSVGHKPDDHVTTSPFALRENGVFKMWYSYRGNKYRIGYGESIDGRYFDRMDAKVGLTVSSTGWDSEMVCYPHVFDICGHRYMLYCGNGYGKTGFGLAVLSDVGK